MESTGSTEENGRQPSGGAGRVEPEGAPAGVDGFTVLQLVPSLDSGGVERGCVDIARALAAAGARPLVASKGGRMESALGRAGGELIRMRIGAKAPWRIRANAKALAALVRAEGVDVIHARSRAPAWAGWFAAQETGAAFVTTWHGTYSENLPFKRRWNGVMARGRPVIAVSDFIAELIARRHPEAEVVTIPRGVDLAAFDEAAVSGERTAGLAERWGLIESPRPVVMLPGRLTRWKGQEHFIDAAAALRAIRGAEDFTFLMVGGDLDGDYARGLERRIRSKD
ncbi:MAG: glycosyltransferase, partial [Pseudomonadota bacterium]